MKNGDFYRHRGKKTHWVPKGKRTSPCGFLDLDWHPVEEVELTLGELPNNTCKHCIEAINMINQK
jgi:hypothetical protein